MQTAKAIVHLNRGHNLPMEGLTPAEAQFLLYEHSENVGGASVTDLVITGEAQDKVGEKVMLGTDGKEVVKKQFKPRTDQAEKARLAAKYVARDKKGNLEIENVFPGINPRLPQKFEEIEFEGQFPFKEGAPSVPEWKKQMAKELRQDGPTLEEFIASGYRQQHYPPSGYAERPSPMLTEYKAQVKREADAKAAADKSAADAKAKADTEAKAGKPTEVNKAPTNTPAK